MEELGAGAVVEGLRGVGGAGGVAVRSASDGRRSSSSSRPDHHHEERAAGRRRRGARAASRTSGVGEVGVVDHHGEGIDATPRPRSPRGRRCVSSSESRLRAGLVATAGRARQGAEAEELQGAVGEVARGRCRARGPSRSSAARTVARWSSGGPSSATASNGPHDLGQRGQRARGAVGGTGHRDDASRRRRGGAASAASSSTSRDLPSPASPDDDGSPRLPVAAASATAATSWASSAVAAEHRGALAGHDALPRPVPDPDRRVGDHRLAAAAQGVGRRLRVGDGVAGWRRGCAPPPAPRPGGHARRGGGRCSPCRR